MAKNRIIWLLPLLLLGACEEKPIDNGNTDIKKFTLEFKGLLNDQELPALGVSDYRSKGDSEEITISNWSMILSELSLIKENGELLPLGDGYQWVAFRNNRTSFDYENIPAGIYKGIHFKVGLDSLINHGNPNIWPADHPLNPNLTGLHWGWSGGYIFHALDGMYRQVGQTGLTTSFSFHTATMPMVREYDLLRTFEIKQATIASALIKVHAENYFDGKVKIKLKDGSVSHSEGTKEILLMKSILSNMGGEGLQNNGVFEFMGLK